MSLRPLVAYTFGPNCIKDRWCERWSHETLFVFNHGSGLWHHVSHIPKWKNFPKWEIFPFKSKWTEIGISRNQKWHFYLKAPPFWTELIEHGAGWCWIFLIVQPDLKSLIQLRFFWVLVKIYELTNSNKAKRYVKMARNDFILRKSRETISVTWLRTVKL